jgi:hypothetical protein
VLAVGGASELLSYQPRQVQQCGPGPVVGLELVDQVNACQQNGDRQQVTVVAVLSQPRRRSRQKVDRHNTPSAHCKKVVQSDRD